MEKALLIAEKPSVARDLEGIYNKHIKEFNIVIDFTSVVGHILELKEPQEYDKRWEKWSFDNLPIFPDRFEYKLSKGKGKVYKEIKDKLAQNKYSYIINACDAGREGELIFYSLYKYLNTKIPVKRLWISDTTEETVIKGLKNLLDDKEFFNLKMSAQCRAYFDWLVGMNLSRAVSLKSKKTIPIGRVMTPTLKLIVDRELEIQNFKAKDYYQIKAVFKDYEGMWFNKNSDKIEDKNTAEKIINKLRKINTGTIEEIKKEQEKTYAPPLFSLLELQKEANNVFGYSADKTLEIAQTLYEKKIITYPRTESKALPKSMGVEIKDYILPLKEHKEYEVFLNYILKDEKIIKEVVNNKKYVDDTKVTDHHAIIPTKTKVNIASLSKEQENIYHLIVKRFLSIFLPPLIINKTTIITKVGEETFKTVGIQEVRKGYTALYTNEKKDKPLPDLKEKQQAEVKDVELLSKKTKPPVRFTEATLLQAMQNAGNFVEENNLKQILKETAGLGTSATRAEIIKKLIEKNFVKRQKKNLIPTTEGITLIENIKDYDFTSPKLTADWEIRLKEIEDGKTNVKTAFEEMKKYVIENVEKIKASNITTIVNKEDIIAKCPICKNGYIIDKKSYYCPSCNFSISKTIKSKTIPKKEIINLLTKKETSFMEFDWGNGKKSKAKLVLQDKKIGFTFEQTKKVRA